MKEQLEAERFSRELDLLLAGRPTAAAGDELAKDLRWAGGLARSDASAESLVRRSLKAELLGKMPEPRPWKVLAWLKAHPIRNAAAGALVAIVVVPLLRFMLAPPPEMRLLGSFGAQGVGFDGAPGGLASPGSLYGTSLDVITPLNVRDPSALAFDGESRADTPVLLRGDEPAPIDREGYARIVEHEFARVADHPLSTFSIDVDAASYANVRRILGEGRLPPKDAVRIEELVNYFRYDYPEPEGEHPFSITADVAECPWKPGHLLARIALKGKSLDAAELPASNLVFLIDTSGSMQDEDKLPLLKRSFAALVEQLREQDRVSIVAYAGAAGLVLPPTSGALKRDILSSLERLSAGGSTAGGAGIELAYKLAAEHFLEKGNNRVILATDGDFNVGLSSDGELTRLIEEKRKGGVFLSVLGFGRGNVQDAKMEQLADKGNGNYAYIDSLREARKVFVREFGGTLFAIAKDVKLQVEFNPARVESYRLIGYENRALRPEDFNDDKKDAGELGAGHNVTALYELVPPGSGGDEPRIDPLKYQKPRSAGPAASSRELLTVKFRYKRPDGDASRLLTRALKNGPLPWKDAPADFRFAAAVAGFGMLLHESPHAGSLDLAKARELARESLGPDPQGDRAEFVRLVEEAGRLRALRTTPPQPR